MAQGALAAFFSYSREDSDFALRLAGDLKAAGANVWLDQLDISPGDRWDRAIEDALAHCPRMVVILSPTSVTSTNVMDEVSFALEEQKTVIPVIYRDCAVPFRLRRVQHVDFKQDYARGLQVLLKILAPGEGVGERRSAIPDVGGQNRSNVSDADERQRVTEQAPLEQELRKAAEPTQFENERRKAVEQARLEVERSQAAEQARVEQEQRRAAEEARLEDERRKTAEQARLEEKRKQAAEQERVEQERKRAAVEAQLENERRTTAEQRRPEEDHERVAQQERWEQWRERSEEPGAGFGFFSKLPVWAKGTVAVGVILFAAWLLYRTGLLSNESRAIGQNAVPQSTASRVVPESKLFRDFRPAATESSAPQTQPLPATTSAQERELWLKGPLYGSDNEGAALRQVTISTGADGYTVYIKNQDGFKCNLYFDDAGDPSRLTHCIATAEPNWDMDQSQVDLHCRPLAKEVVCSGTYLLRSEFTKLEVTMTIARRTPRVK